MFLLKFSIIVCTINSSGEIPAHLLYKCIVFAPNYHNKKEAAYKSMFLLFYRSAV
jgi:hypothetical protein